ncbi:hypothetical protein JTB14_033450 [Gonioctena quinquepunctata]|nr:hypothetical protein JTB14_033450 [Gonioctena quinquepunctata]
MLESYIKQSSNLNYGLTYMLKPCLIANIQSNGMQESRTPLASRIHEDDPTLSLCKPESTSLTRGIGFSKDRNSSDPLPISVVTPESIRPFPKVEKDIKKVRRVRANLPTAGLASMKDKRIKQNQANGNIFSSSDTESDNSMNLDNDSDEDISLQSLQD